MQRQVSNGWLVLMFWVPVIALVLGLVLGCAATDAGASRPIAPPAQAELRRLVAQELDDDSRFDSFGAVDSGEARRMAAVFRPVLASVVARECRTAGAESMDCTLDVVLSFPAMGGRESHTTWERRLRREQGGWQIVGQSQP
jgi:hypothetical protein